MQKLSPFLLVLAILLSSILRTEAQICGREGDTCYFFGCCDGYECAGSFSKACKLVEGESTTAKPDEEPTTTKRPEGESTDNPDTPTTTGQPEKVVYTTIKFVTKEYLESNFPGTWDDSGDNSTEASLDATTSAVQSESAKPSVEPSGDKTTPTTSNTQVSDQKTEQHIEKQPAQLNQTQHQQGDHYLNRTSTDHNSTHTGHNSTHPGFEPHSNHTGGLHLNDTATHHHSNHSSSSSSGASPLSSYYFLLYLPFVTTMWYLV